MSPEMFLIHTEGENSIGEFRTDKSDIFSLGITLLRVILSLDEI